MTKLEKAFKLFREEKEERYPTLHDICIAYMEEVWGGEFAFKYDRTDDDKFLRIGVYNKQTAETLWSAFENEDVIMYALTNTMLFMTDPETNIDPIIGITLGILTVETVLIETINQSISYIQKESEEWEIVV
jgi:hypothetical protein